VLPPSPSRNFFRHDNLWPQKDTEGNISISVSFCVFLWQNLVDNCGMTDDYQEDFA